MISHAAPMPTHLDAAALREIVLAAGADDVGFVSMGDPAIDDQRADILAAFPFARTLISFVVKMNRENIRSPARSLANLEFHHANDDCDEISRAVVNLDPLSAEGDEPALGACEPPHQIARRPTAAPRVRKMLPGVEASGRSRTPPETRRNAGLLRHAFRPAFQARFCFRQPLPNVPHMAGLFFPHRHESPASSTRLPDDVRESSSAAWAPEAKLLAAAMTAQSAKARIFMTQFLLHNLDSEPFALLSLSTHRL